MATERNSEAMLRREEADRVLGRLSQRALAADVTIDVFGVGFKFFDVPAYNLLVDASGQWWFGWRATVGRNEGVRGSLVKTKAVLSIRNSRS